MTVSTETAPRAPSEYSEEVYDRLQRIFEINECLEDDSKAILELWSICDTEDQKNMIEDLLSNFYILRDRDFRRKAEQVSKQIRLEWGLTSRVTRIIAVSDDFNADGSLMFLQMIKDKFPLVDGWSENNFVNDFIEGVKYIKSGMRLVLLDDFIGTGKTAHRKVSWYLDRIRENSIQDIEVYLVAIAGMEFSRNLIDGLDIKYYCPIWLKKGITERLNGQDQLQQFVNSMKDLEKKLYFKFKGEFIPRFGYKRSEALFCIHGCNIPNNVFPVFWWPLDSNKSFRQTVFRRLR